MPSKLKIHNVRFYRPEPRLIYCMALEPSEKKLAVSRSDASLEIWNLNNSIFLERTIAPSSENDSIEGLIWCDKRLFSVGLHGLLIEYDLQKLDIRNRAAVTGEAAFCLDVNSSQNEIAVGTEQGYINIFRIDKDGAFFEKFLDKQEGRILCIKYVLPSAEYIVSGGIDAIRIFCVKTGHAIHKLTTGRSETNKPTIVWCLQITRDFTIISGDSRGKLTFWDGKIGAQIESYQSHAADILSLYMSEDENLLCCAGVDPTITNYVRIIVKDGNKKYVKSIQRKIHEHDVRAMVICDNKLYSGGADSYLVCSFHPPKTQIKIPPLLQNPCIYLCSEANLILLRYAKQVEIWSLGRITGVDESFTGFLNIAEQPKKLIVYQRTVKDYQDNAVTEGIICCCISDDGKWFVVSTNSGTRLFEMIYEENKCNLAKVDELENSTVPCLQAIFSPNCKQLIVAPNTGGLKTYKLDNSTNVNIIQNIEFNSKITDAVTFLIISKCGQFLVAADPKSNICVWSINRNAWSFYVKLPKYDVGLTSLAIHPTTLDLVIAYSDSKLVEYSIKEKHLNNFSKNMASIVKTYPIRNITFDPRNKSIILLQDDNSSIIVVDKEKMLKTEAKVAKLNDLDASVNNKKGGYNIIKKYKHLVSLQWLANDEMVAVELSPLSIFEQLPPVFFQNAFGTK